MASMQKLAGLMRRAIEKYDMIQPRDRIAIGISGGKDSIVIFQPALPARGATGLHQDVRRPAAISIHTPHRESGEDVSRSS